MCITRTQLSVIVLSLTFLGQSLMLAHAAAPLVRLTVQQGDLAPGYGPGHGESSSLWVSVTLKPMLQREGFTGYYYIYYSNQQNSRVVINEIFAFKNTTGAHTFYEWFRKCCLDQFGSPAHGAPIAAGDEMAVFHRTSATGGLRTVVFRRRGYVEKVTLQGPGATWARLRPLVLAVDRRAARA